MYSYIQSILIAAQSWNNNRCLTSVLSLVITILQYTLYSWTQRQSLNLYSFFLLCFTVARFLKYHAECKIYFNWSQMETYAKQRWQRSSQRTK